MSRAIAVIGGTGPAGSGLALRWVRAGEKVIIGSRDAARAQQAAEKIQQRVGPQAQVSGLDNSAACAASDLLVLTVLDRRGGVHGYGIANATRAL